MLLHKREVKNRLTLKIFANFGDPEFPFFGNDHSMLSFRGAFVMFIGVPIGMHGKYF